jgi:hypothetical protein
MLVTGYCTSAAAYRWTANHKVGEQRGDEDGHSLRSWSAAAAAVTALAAAPVAFVAIASAAVVAGHTFRDRQEC